MVPTLAQILGVPIPYSNLGAIQYHLLPDVSVTGFVDYEMLLLHGWQNTIQIYTYFQNYATEHKGTFKKHELDELKQKFIILSHRANSVYTYTGFQSFSKDLNSFLLEILHKCRELWVKFDANLMSKGLLVVFITLLGFFLLVNNLTVHHYNKIFTKSFIGLIVLSNLAGYNLVYFLSLANIMTIEITDVLFYSCIYSFAILTLNILQNWSDISENWDKQSKSSSKLMRVVFIVFISVFYSNSYTVEEQKILNYILVGLAIFALINIMSGLMKKRFWKFAFLVLGSVIILRVSYHLFKCREEQKECAVDFEKNSFKFASMTKEETTPGDLVGVIVLALFTTVSKMYLKSMGNLSGTSLHVMFYRYSPTVATICACGHFLLAKNRAVSLKPIHIDGLAWVVYFITIAHVIIFLIDPLLLFIMPQSNSSDGGTVKFFKNQNIIPEIFNIMKKKTSEKVDKEAENENKVPIVYGLGTVYSASMIALASTLTILFALLLGKTASAGIVLMICVGIVICATGCANKGTNIKDIRKLIKY